jgi:hypothetical protein
LRYALMSVNDERAKNKAVLRSALKRWEEVPLPFYTPDTIKDAPFELAVNKTNLLKGQLAFWYSAMSSLSVAPGLVVEDDSMVLLPPKNLKYFLDDLPGDTDFAALCIPLDELDRFDESFLVTRKLCRIWQTKATAATYYTQQGADKIRWLVERDGIIDQYDGQIMTYAREGELTGYTTRGDRPPLMSTRNLRSQIQYTEWVQ